MTGLVRQFALFFILSLVSLGFPVACAQNTISGTVFVDLNNNATMDGAERGQGAIRVHLYEDLNGNGIIDAGERRLQTTLTNASGGYNFSFGGPSANYTVQRRLVGSNNDAEERLSNGAMDLTSSDLELIYDGFNQIVGVRFTNVLVPRGATVANATVSFEVDEAGAAGTTDLTFRAHNIDNSPEFTAGTGNISGRAQTTASVTWSAVPDPAVNAALVTPDLASVVQEVVDRAGWQPGNALTILITGTGRRTVEAFEGEQANAPFLAITYTMPATTLTTYLVQVESADLSPSAVLTAPGTRAVSFPAASGHSASVSFSYNGETTACYGVADSDDSFWLMNRFSGQNFRIGLTGVGDVEAMATSLDRNTIYAMNGNRLGTVDILNGTFSPAPNTVGSGNGALGTINMSDIDGMTVDQLTGILWGAVRRGSPNADLLIHINPTTGRLITNAFGPGIDYLPVSGGLPDVDDFTVDPFTGIMYATNSDGGSGTQLVTVDKTTGALTVIGPLGIGDVEGFGATDCGDLYASTGEGGTINNRNSLWAVSKVTGNATPVGMFAQGTPYAAWDFEAANCLFAPANRISGKVFDDLDNNATDDGEPGVPNVAVELYQDNNNNGLVDAGDVLLQTALTDAVGAYFFDLASVQGNYVLQTNEASYPVGYVATTDNVEAQSYPTCTVGQIYDNKSFGLRDIPLASAPGLRLRYEDKESYPFVWTALVPCTGQVLEHQPINGEWSYFSTSYLPYNHPQRFILNPNFLPQVLPGYYRVKAWNEQGQEIYSNVVQVHMANLVAGLEISGIHYTQGLLQLWGHWASDSPLTLQVVDSKGAQVYYTSLYATRETQETIRIPLPHNWAPGIYQAIVSQKGTQRISRWVVQ
ncbi:MAG: hypothetical protein KF690_10580 [Bacteroidetes bacterium]|nr:hypothetical protein [Bacteroidota bacterium]